MWLMRCILPTASCPAAAASDDDAHFVSATVSSFTMSCSCCAGEQPDQDRIYSDGWSYLQSTFPLLSYVTSVTVTH